MKKAIIMAAMTAAVLSLAGCGKDDGPQRQQDTDTKEDIWWGYFQGEFNGTVDADDISVSFRNDRNRMRVRSICEFYNPGAGDKQERIVIKNTGIEYLEGTSGKDASYISLSISGLEKGVKRVTQSVREPAFEALRHSTIKLTRQYEGDAAPVEYVPSEHNPFEVEIIDVTWVSPSLPVVEAKLNGVLYRRDAPRQDSIIVKAVYGAGFGMI